MFNTSTLPGSIAVPFSTELPKLKSLYYTAKEGIDEKPLYRELNHRLTQLETSTELHEEELSAIEDATANLVVAIEANEEVQLRIDWLKRLYEVKKSLPIISTLTESERLRTMLSPVQTCPLKSELLTALDQLAASLPTETELPVQTEFDSVMEFAIEKAGDDFINLGKAGREHVVNDLLKKFGDDVSVTSIQEAVSSLEHEVNSLAELEDAQALQVQLEALPLSNYSRLSTERKQTVAEQLLENKQWKGLALLDRLIGQLDAKLSSAEEQEQLQSMASGVSDVINFKHFDGLAIQTR